MSASSRLEFGILSDSYNCYTRNTSLSHMVKRTKVNNDHISFHDIILLVYPLTLLVRLAFASAKLLAREHFLFRCTTGPLLLNLMNLQIIAANSLIRLKTRPHFDNPTRLTHHCPTFLQDSRLQPSYVS